MTVALPERDLPSSWYDPDRVPPSRFHLVIQSVCTYLLCARPGLPPTVTGPSSRIKVGLPHGLSLAGLRDGDQMADGETRIGHSAPAS